MATTSKPESQTLIMNRKRFPTKDSAKAWASERGYATNKIRETTNNWRVIQASPEDFAADSFQVMQLEIGRAHV